MKILGCSLVLLELIIFLNSTKTIGAVLSAPFVYPWKKKGEIAMDLNQTREEAAALEQAYARLEATAKKTNDRLERASEQVTQKLAGQNREMDKIASVSFTELLKTYEELNQKIEQHKELLTSVCEEMQRLNDVSAHMEMNEKTIERLQTLQDITHQMRTELDLLQYQAQNVGNALLQVTESVGDAGMELPVAALTNIRTQLLKTGGDVKNTFLATMADVNRGLGNASQIVSGIKGVLDAGTGSFGNIPALTSVKSVFGGLSGALGILGGVGDVIAWIGEKQEELNQKALSYQRLLVILGKRKGR